MSKRPRSKPKAELKWVPCNGSDMTTWPREAGHYAFMTVSADAQEHDDYLVGQPQRVVGEVYRTIGEPPYLNHPGIAILFDIEEEEIVAWYGPLAIPRCDCVNLLTAAALRKSVLK